MSDSINVIEIFSSIQGEGVLAGVRQIFIRLPACNMTCSYCDTDTEIPEYCKIETAPGSAQFELIKNPLSFNKIVDLLNAWNIRHHHSISITGGEPLLHAEKLELLLHEIKKILPVYLETNGTLPDRLSGILDFIEYVSMDIKLKSSTGVQTPWETHREFIRIAHFKKLTVKAVVNSFTTIEEISKASMITAEVGGDDIPFIIQPETTSAASRKVSAKLLISLYEAASQNLSNVRVIPQQHHLLGFL